MAPEPKDDEERKPPLVAVPLVAACVAPLITLLDIPALTQRWYYVNGLPTDDPVESVVLSAVSLGLCFLGNALLVLRFSSNAPSVRAFVVEAPLVCFWIKTAVEVANLAVYARANSRPDNYVLGQAFWAAIFSCGLSGIVSVLLLVHFVVQRQQKYKDSIKHRVDGRHFLLSVTAFVVVIALHALAFSEIEGYVFWDGVFAAIVTCTTIGFGDLAPRHVSTKILLFVFFAVDVALLGNMISMIVGYIGESRVRRHKVRMQGLLMSRHGRSVDKQKEWGLVEELDFLDGMQKRERDASQIYDLIVSLTTFVVFSVVGAAIFQHSEQYWSFGDALYFVLVFSFTIGFGDLVPTSPLSRVFFVLYALIAVPVVASFATQTVTTLVEQFSKQSLSAAHVARKKHLRRGPDANPADEEEAEAQEEESEGLKAHHFFVWGKWNELKRSSKDQAQRSAEQRRQDEAKLASEALELACQLESLSRCMLISALGSGKARNLLRADRHIQRRDIKAAGGGEKMTELWAKEDQCIGNSSDDLMGSINEYRQTFAHLLAVGAKLKELEGVNRKAFLRVRLDDDDEKDNQTLGKNAQTRADIEGDDKDDDVSSNHSRAEEEMEMMDEMGSIDVQNEDGEAVKVDVKEKKERDEAKQERVEKREKRKEKQQKKEKEQKTDET